MAFEPKFIKDYDETTEVNDDVAIELDTGVNTVWVKAGNLVPVKIDGTDIVPRDASNSYKGAMVADSLTASDGVDIPVTGTLDGVSLSDGRVYQYDEDGEGGVYQWLPLTRIDLTGNFFTIPLLKNYPAGTNISVEVMLSVPDTISATLTWTAYINLHNSVFNDTTALDTGTIAITNSTGNILSQRLSFTIEADSNCRAGRYLLLSLSEDSNWENIKRLHINAYYRATSNIIYTSGSTPW